MDLNSCSVKLLEELHNAVRNALVEDDKLTKAGKGEKFGARKYPDWKQIANELESVMTKKSISFTRIKW